jgi:hypothetical protein
MGMFIAKCPIHNTDLICPACLGSHRSAKKTAAARRNAKRGGRPRLDTQSISKSALRQRARRARLKAMQPADSISPDAPKVKVVSKEEGEILDQKENIQKLKADRERLMAGSKAISFLGKVWRAQEKARKQRILPPAP